MYILVGREDFTLSEREGSQEDNQVRLSLRPDSKTSIYDICDDEPLSLAFADDGRGRASHVLVRASTFASLVSALATDPSAFSNLLEELQRQPDDDRHDKTDKVRAATAVLHSKLLTALSRWLPLRSTSRSSRSVRLPAHRGLEILRLTTCRHQALQPPPVRPLQM